jgi:hypothetical protein
MKMFCPKCGKGDQQPNAYCRACGDWLIDMNAAKKSGNTTKMSPEQRAQTMMIFCGLSAAFAIVVAIALLAGFAGRGGMPRAVGVGIGFSIAVVSWQIVNFLFALQFYRQFKRRKNTAFAPKEFGVRSFANNALPAADTSEIIRPAKASVTEHTTEFLESVAPRRRSDS